MQVRIACIGSLLSLAMLPLAALADDDDGYQGIVALVSAGVDRPYPGERTDHSLAPLVVGNWRNVYFEGPRVTIGLHQGDGWSFAALAQARLHQYAPGRRRSLDLGGVVTVPVGRWYLQAGAVRDVVGAHGGIEYEVRALTTWRSGPWSLTPTLAVQRQDDDLAGYYFATGAMTNVSLETFASYALEGGWVMVGSLRHVEHGASGIGATRTWALGFGRTF